MNHLFYYINYYTTKWIGVRVAQNSSIGTDGLGSCFLAFRCRC